LSACPLTSCASPAAESPPRPYPTRYPSPNDAQRDSDDGSESTAGAGGAGAATLLVAASVHTGRAQEVATPEPLDQLVQGPGGVLLLKLRWRAHPVTRRPVSTGRESPGAAPRAGATATALGIAIVRSLVTETLGSLVADYGTQNQSGCQIQRSAVVTR